MASAAAFALPKLYPIVDAATLSRAGIPAETFARELYRTGIRFLQYRDKEGSDLDVQEVARMLRKVFPAGEAKLILNDRAHLVAAIDFDGLHIGQEDLSPAAAREIVGPHRILGLSTHGTEQLAAADAMPVDYLAIGPVFTTQSKDNPDPVVGLAVVREARSLTDKPLVAIGGITQANARGVLDAGADCLALISALLPSPDRSVAKVIADFLASIG